MMSWASSVPRSASRMARNPSRLHPAPAAGEPALRLAAPTEAPMTFEPPVAAHPDGEPALPTLSNPQQ